MADLQFDESMFFNIILPAIMFPSGYNMRRKKFFKNIVSILKFGLIATIFCFAIYSGAMIGLWKADLLKKYDPKTDSMVPVELNYYQIINTCALLCSSDVIAAISMINF